MACSFQNILPDRLLHPRIGCPAPFLRYDGQGDDVEAADEVYTATLPAQEHRTLVRYRVRVTDAESVAVTVPYQDDRSLNFAYFVYNGVPPYVASRRSVHPDGTGHAYSSELMTSLPVYHLITRAEALFECFDLGVGPFSYGWSSFGGGLARLRRSCSRRRSPWLPKQLEESHDAI